MIFFTPFATKHCTTANPIGPPPRTRTVSDNKSGAADIACHATDSGSTSAPISRETFAGSARTVEAGIVRESLRPPPPPISVSNLQNFNHMELISIPLSPMNPLLWQTFSAPLRHAAHSEQNIDGCTTTFSPTLNPVTPEPRAVIVPLNSWPKVTGMVS
jgi:hypothetical protein